MIKHIIFDNQFSFPLSGHKVTDVFYNRNSSNLVDQIYKSNLPKGIHQKNKLSIPMVRVSLIMESKKIHY